MLLKTVRDFLYRWKLIIVVNGKYSLWAATEPEVPQGSIFIPFFFLVCIQKYIWWFSIQCKIICRWYISVSCGRKYDQISQQVKQWLRQNKYLDIPMDNEL